MKSAVRLFSTSLLTGMFLVACAPSDSSSGGTGGAPANRTGGSTASGGSSSSGGSTGTGGSVTSTGGAQGTGGSVSSTGGAQGTGGASSGGATGTGGGSQGTGGSSSTGGSAPGTGGRGNMGSGGAVGTGGGGPTGTGGTMGGGGAAGGGSGTVTFAAVATILGNSCGTGQCHNGMQHTDLRNNAGLHARIVGAMPAGTMVEATCTSRTLVTPGNLAMSVISGIIKTGGVTGCGPRMPNQCPNMRACLTNAQIATIDAWIMAGAPM